MRFLESAAKAKGINLIRLETGTRQIGCQKMYSKLGYSYRSDPYGDHPGHFTDIYMEKPLEDEIAVNIMKADPKRKDIRDVIRDLEDELGALYPPEACSWDSPEVLAAENVTFVGAFDGNAVVAGIGAIKYFKDYAEIKRLFVNKGYRGHGIAMKIMTFLENDAISKGTKVIRVETGTLQTEAISLYERKLGYNRRGKYGDYVDNDTSIFLEKYLSA